MFSTRFNLPVVLTLHARKRLLDRAISIEELMQVIDTGETRFKAQPICGRIKISLVELIIWSARCWSSKTPWSLKPSCTHLYWRINP